MFISAGNEEIFPFAKPLGIGSEEIAINLTRELLLNPPKEIIFIGSAGSYGNKKIFEVFESESAVHIPHCYLENNCYTPIKNKIVSRETETINSLNYITTSKIHSLAYLKLGIEAENMEFFSVMKVCSHFNIKAKGIFIITNYTHKDAHKEYIQNIKKAKEILTDYIKGAK
ncbi:MAG: purine-nucleoside phosphorylase [Epsilonproteobacteria bacterium]|nr:purine-nucleoside phosphorylase [Campylobacterota bacterium]